MANPLDGLAKTIAGAFKDLFYAATLVRSEVLPTSPTFDPADPPPPTLVNYPCKALRDTYSAYDRQNSNIGTSDVKIMILANSITTKPITDDVIVYQGAKFNVIRSDIDPAGAVWVCQASQ